MPEGKLPDITAQHIPPLAHDGENEYHDHGVEKVRGNSPGQHMERN
jgi:hypothetical protein